MTISRDRGDHFYLFHHTFVPSGTHTDYLGSIAFTTHIDRLTQQPRFVLFPRGFPLVAAIAHNFLQCVEHDAGDLVYLRTPAVRVVRQAHAADGAIFAPGGAGHCRVPGDSVRRDLGRCATAAAAGAFGAIAAGIPVRVPARQHVRTFF